MEFQSLSEVEEKIGQIIVPAYQVHRSIGPGLLEKVYEVCLSHELKKSGWQIKRQVDMPIL
jgi:GxxExxY protein